MDYGVRVRARVRVKTAEKGYTYGCIDAGQSP